MQNGKPSVSILLFILSVIIPAGPLYAAERTEYLKTDREIAINDELVPFAAGALDYFDNGVIKRGRLSEDAVIQGITFRAGTDVFFQYESGRVYTGVLAGDAVIQGYAIRGGTEVRFHEDLGAVPLRISSAELAEDAVIQGYAVKAGSRIGMAMTGKLEWLIPSADIDIDGRFYKAGRKLDFFQDRLWKGVLSADAVIAGVDLGAGSALSFFQNTGLLEDVYPIKDTSVHGFPCKGNTLVRFRRDGSLWIFQPPADVEIQGILCKGDKGVLLHANGKLNICVLAEDAVIQGIALKAGSQLRLNADGILGVELVSLKSSGFPKEAYDRNIYHPVKAFDADPATAWIEDEPGFGRGAYIEVEFKDALVVDEIRVCPGYFDKRWWAQNNRIKTALVEFDGAEKSLEFQDSMEEQSFTLAQAVSFKKFSIAIGEAFAAKGVKENDTALSEVGFFCKGRRISIDFALFKEFLKSSSP